MKEEQVPIASSVRTAEAPPETAVAAAVAKRWKVFLAWAEDDVADQREQLAVMLDKAGFDVWPKQPLPSAGPELISAVKAVLEATECSMHVLGGGYGPRIEPGIGLSRSHYQFNEATRHTDFKGGDYRRLVWTLPLVGRILEGDQQEFLTQIQNGLSSNMLMSSTAAAQQVIEDSIAFLDSRPERKVVAKEYDIAFISNIQDAADCYDVIEKLSEEFRTQTLTIVPEKDIDYRKEAEDILMRSRMAVVYFKDASDWAVSFTKLTWKHIGGVSAGVPILLVGEDEPRRNRFIKFRAPQVQTIVVPKDQILATVREVQQRVAQTGQINSEVYCPYTGLRPFNEDESIFFRGREKHIDTIIETLAAQKFSMVTGSSGDGKSSLLYAGVIPSLKGGFLKTQYTKWAVADFRPERTPLKNLSAAIATQLKIRNPDEVEHTLSYGFSALVDLYKQSSLYVDPTSNEYMEADDDKRKYLRRQAANLLILVDQFEEFFTNVENYREGVASPVAQITVNVLLETIRIAREQGLPIYVVFTMRSDYIGQCVSFRGFAEMIGLSTYFVPRLKREEIQEVVESPARLNGNKISNRLVQRILNDLGDGIDQLPVLQHCMHQIWTSASRGEEMLDLMHYAKVGGLAASKLPREDKPAFDTWFETLDQDTKGLYDKPRLRNVLNRHANELYFTSFRYFAEHNPGQAVSKEDAQFILRMAFTALTKIDENRAVRNRMALQEITDLIGVPEFNTQVVNRVLNIFRAPGNTFVQPYLEEDNADLPSNTVLDITHEALIRNWDKLTEWAEREYKGVAKYQDFKEQVYRWLKEDCSPKFLLNSGTYNYFNSWYEEQRPTAAWIRRYIRPEEMNPEMEPMEQATYFLEDLEEFLELSRQRIERNKRLVMFVIALISILFLAALAAAFWANHLRVEADRQRIEAEAARLEAIRQTRIAEANATAAYIARRNAEIEYLRAEENFILAEQQKRFAVTEREKAEFERRRAEIQAKIAERERANAEDQRTLAEQQRDIAQRATVEARRQTQIAQYQREQALVQRDNAYVMQSMFLSFQSEEQTSQSNPVEFEGRRGSPAYQMGPATPGALNGRNGRGVIAGQSADPRTAMLLALEGLPQDLSSPSRPYVAEAEAALYFAADAVVNDEPQITFQGHRNNVVFSRFSPDGTKLITTSWDMTARVWDVNTGQQLNVFRGHNHIVEKAFFSTDGNFVVTVAEDYTARLWDVRSQSELATYRGHANLLTHAALSPDNSRVVTTSVDNTARLWDARTGRQVSQLNGHTGAVNQAAFSPNGRVVVTCSKDNSARLWDASSGTLMATLHGHRDNVNQAVFSPNGRYVVTVSDDRTVRLWDVNSGRQIHQMVGHTAEVRYAAFSNDGRKVVTTGSDGTARVWDVATGQQFAALRGHTGPVYHATFSPDDQRIVTSSEDRSARLWDANSYLRLAIYNNLPPTPYPASFSPDSRYIAVAQGRPHNVKIYRVLPPGQALIDMVRSELNPGELTPRDRSRFFLQDQRLQREISQEEYLRQLEQNEQNELNLRQQQQQQSPQQGGSQPNTTPTQPRAPEATSAQSNGHREGFHVVQPGETIWHIAHLYGARPDDLRSWNGISGNSISVGQVLRVRQ